MMLCFRRLAHPLRSSSVIALLLAAALVLVAGGGGTVAAAGEGDTRSFLITRSALAFNYDAMDVDCPTGFELTTEDGFLATLTPAERERLLRPENADEYGYKWRQEYITGPGGENVCNNPKSFLTDPRHPAYRGVQSTVAYGLNLDGTTDGGATPNSCAHEKFEDLNGGAAVDNQLYRALGCSKTWRLQPDSGGRYFDSYLIEVRGLNDMRNDDHVEVGIYSTEDVSMRSQTGAHLPNQSFRVTANPRWRTETTGRIVEGLLMTDVIEAMYLRWQIPLTGAFGQASEFEFHDVRFQVSLQPDGTVKGLLGGYRPIDNIAMRYRCCKSAATAGNNNCAAEHKTLVALADGYPDPDTGQCTMISSAQNVEGIPAFVVH